MIDEHTEVNLKIRCNGLDFKALMGAVKNRMYSLSKSEAEYKSLEGIYESLQPYAALCQ